MAKKSGRYVFFVWNNEGEFWQECQEKFNLFDFTIVHHKNVQGRPWTVYRHSSHPGLHFGRWTDNGPQVPPYR